MLKMTGNEIVEEKTIFGQKVKVANGRIVISEKTAIKMYLATTALGVLAIINVLLSH